MIVWRTKAVKTYSYGEVKSVKYYKMLLLFGIIPLYIAIDG